MSVTYKFGKYVSPVVWSKCCYFSISFEVLFVWKATLEVYWEYLQAGVSQWSTRLVGDPLYCVVTVSVGHRVLCETAAHWPVVTVAS